MKTCRIPYENASRTGVRILCNNYTEPLNRNRVCNIPRFHFDLFKDQFCFSELLDE